MDRSAGRPSGWTKPEAVFTRLGLAFGLIFLVVTPPFQVADESDHFRRAYQLSEGRVRPLRQGMHVGGLLPRSVEITVVDAMGGIAFNPHQKQSVDNVIALLSMPLNAEDRVFSDFRSTAIYSPLAHLPQAVGVATGKRLGLAPLGAAYVGRLTNLLAALALTALAIRIIPFMKWGMVLLALTPMAVFQRSSLSADVLLNAVAAILVAVVLRAATRTERLRLGEILLYAALTSGLGLCKPPYLALGLLCLTIPSARFGGIKPYVLANAGVLASAVLTTGAWNFMVRDLFVVKGGAPNTVGLPGAELGQLMEAQIGFLLSDPRQIVAIFWNTIAVQWSFYHRSFIGILGWLDTNLPTALTTSYTWILCLVAIVDGDQAGTLNRRVRLCIAAVAVVGLIGLGLSIYLQWSPTGGSYIEGIQGRYFIPYAPLLLLLMSSRRCTIDFGGTRLHWAVIAYVIGAMMVTLHSLGHRYYARAALIAERFS